MNWAALTRLRGFSSVSIVWVYALAGSAIAQETAATLPMWYDAAAGPPPNIRVDSDATSDPRNEECVAVDPTNPNNLVAVWRRLYITPPVRGLQVDWGYSHDGGFTWTVNGPLSAGEGFDFNNDSDPTICSNTEGRFHVAVLSVNVGSGPAGLYSPISIDSGMSWLLTTEVAPSDPFDPSLPFEDKEWITCDQTGGPGNNNLYVAWTSVPDLTPPTTASVKCARSEDGFVYTNPVIVSDPPDVRRIWAVPAVGADGRVLIAWLSWPSSIIAYDISFDHGTTWGVDRTLQPVSFLQETIQGDVMIFAIPALTSDMTQSPYRGRFYCAFSDSGSDGSVDLFLTMSLDSGMTWTPRRRLNDDPVGSGADQFHPWISVNPDGVVSVVFYDRRLDASNTMLDLWMTHSFDGGMSWTPNQRVSNVSFSPYVDVPMERVFAEYIGLTSSRLRATTVFTDTRTGNADVYAANMPLRLFPPRLITPADSLITNDPKVTFTWGDWSIYETALTYVLEYSTDGSFEIGVTRHEDLTEQERIEFLSDGFYYWRVRAFDTFGDSSAVQTHTIWVDLTPPDPPTPIPPSPLTGDTIIDVTPSFAWTPSLTRNSALPTPVAYCLELASDPGFTSDLRSYADLQESTFELSANDSLYYDQTWYWHVSATDAAGNASAFCEIESFYLRSPCNCPNASDFDEDGFLTALDLSSMIDILFAGDPEVQDPNCPSPRADFDCDGFSTSLDLGSLIDHLFAGGDGPCDPCAL